MKLYGKYTAEQILKGLLYETGNGLLKVKVSSIEMAKASQMYGATGSKRQTMALDIEVNADMANGHDEIAQQNTEAAP